MTTMWHEDDLLGSCTVDVELPMLLCYLVKTHGPKLIMHADQKYDYLGVDLDFQEDGKVEVLMVNYMKNVKQFS
jgi:hypothetical protein